LSAAHLLTAKPLDGVYGIQNLKSAERIGIVSGTLALTTETNKQSGFKHVEVAEKSS